MTDFKPHGIHLKSLPLDTLKSDLLKKALVVWEASRGENKAPLWEDIDLFAFPAPLLPMMTVVDVLDGGKEFQYRYWGSALTAIFGRDETGSLLSEHEMSASGEIRARQFVEVVENFQPMFFMTIFNKSEGLLAEKLNLRLPVADHSNQIAKIITLSTLDRARLKDHEDLKEYWLGQLKR